MLLAVGVKVAVKILGSPVPARPLIVPLVAEISAAMKPLGISEKEKVMVAVCPALRELVLLEMVSVGASVS